MNDITPNILTKFSGGGPLDGATIEMTKDQMMSTNFMEFQGKNQGVDSNQIYIYKRIDDIGKYQLVLVRKIR
jgi:hypothetical protein